MGERVEPEETSAHSDAEKPVDGYCSVRVTRDGMRALMNLQPSQNGGKPLTVESARLALQKARVVHGVNKELLKKLVTNVEKSGSGKNGVIIAQGQKPENGTDGSVEFLFSEDESVLERQEHDDEVDEVMVE